MSENKEVVVLVDFQDLKQLFFEKQVRDRNGFAIADFGNLVELAKVWFSDEKLNVASDNAPNGVPILTFSLPANTIFVFTKIKVASDGEQTISIAFGTALDGSQTDVDHTYLNSKQTYEEFSDKTPAMAILNNTDAPVNVFIYAKTGTIMGVVNNPAAGARHYMAVIGGFFL
jgi:hypothetical protein